VTADVVTGKLDDREAGARLPEPADNPAESTDPDLNEPLGREEQE
jgi:hypothetical protein